MRSPVGGAPRGAVRFDVGDLSRAATGEVLEAVLSAARSGPTRCSRFYEASDGNPLVLRELVHLALAEERLKSETGTWRLFGELAPSRRLADLLGARLAVLTDDARAILNQLALCAPLGAAELTGDVSSRGDRGPGTRRPGARGGGRVAPPAGAGPPALRRGAARRPGGDGTPGDPAGGGRAHGRARVPDAARMPRRVATWRLDGGGDPDPTLLLQAAVVARNANDFRGVERLATHLRRIDPTVESAILLGEARFELGEFEGAEAVLAEPATGATSLQLAQRAGIRAKNLQWGLCDWQTALQVVRDARSETASDVTDDLIAAEGAVRLFSGSPSLRSTCCPRSRRPTPAVAVQVAIDRSPALALVGRPDEAIDVAEAAFAAHLGLAQPVGLAHPGTHVVNQAFALIEAGRLGEARELSLAGYEVAVSDRIPVAQIWFAIMLGKIDLLRGRILESRAWYREGRVDRPSAPLPGPAAPCGRRRGRHRGHPRSWGRRENGDRGDGLAPPVRLPRARPGDWTGLGHLGRRPSCRGSDHPARRGRTGRRCFQPGVGRVVVARRGPAGRDGRRRISR